MILRLNVKNLINMLALLTIMLGGYFKTHGLAGATALLLTGTGCLLLTLIFLIKEMELEEMPVSFTYTASMALLLHVLGATFKRLQWPGGNPIIWLALVMSVLAVMVFCYNKTELKIPKQFAISMFLYLLLAMNLLDIWNLNL